MAGFLESLGRTNALSTATSNLTNTALGIREFQQKQALTNEQFEINKLQKQKAEIELKQAQEEQVRNSRVVPVSVVKQIFQFPEIADYAEKVAAGFGVIDTSSVEPTIQVGHIQAVLKVLQEPFHNTNVAAMKINASKKQWQGVNEELVKYTEGKTQEELKDDKKFITLSQQVQQAQGNYIMATNENKALQEFNKNIFKNFTPQSVQEYMTSGDSSKLEELKKQTKETDFEKLYNEQHAINPSITRLDLKKRIIDMSRKPEKPEKPLKESDFEKMFKEELKTDPTMTRFRLRQKLAGLRPQTEPGVLNDSAALENFRASTDYDEVETQKRFNEYVELKKQGMNGTEAFDFVQQKYSNSEVTTTPSQTDFSNLWE